jgi:imidazolonepropionase
MSRLAILNCSQLVTVAGPARPRTGHEMSQIGIIRDGGLIIEEGRIARVGSRPEIEPLLGPDDAVLDAAGGVVLPGWVDAHTHAVFGGTRVDEYELRALGATYQDIARRGGGIRSTMRHTREASEDDLVEIGKKHAQWFLQGGTTTIEAKSGYGLTVEDELKILRAIQRLREATPLDWVPTLLAAHAIPPEFESSADYLQEVVLPLLESARGLARYCDIFVESGYFSADEARLVVRAAKERGYGIRMHVDQLTAGAGGAELAAELGATTADHLEKTSEPGIAALKAAGVMPVLLPASVYALGLKHYPSARAMIEAGLPVVLASDFNPGSSPTPSMPMVLSLACTQMGVTPAEAVTAATVNAAYSLDLGHDRGTLEAGKRADVAIYDCNDYREIPYFFGVQHVRRVLVGGQEVFPASILPFP